MKKTLFLLCLTTLLFSCSSDEVSQKLDEKNISSSSKTSEQTTKENGIIKTNSNEDPNNPDTGLSVDPGQDAGGSGTTCTTSVLVNGNCTTGLINATKHLDNCYGLTLSASYSTDTNSKINFQNINIRFDNNKFALLSQYQIFDATSKDVTVYITYKYTYQYGYNDQNGFPKIGTTSENRSSSIRINVCSKTIN